MIKAEGLTMHYGPVTALEDVSFEVNQGEIVGLLGPNGAGKSTTMKILTTYLHPTSGAAKVGGIDVLENPLGVRKIIGYLPEVLPLYMDMEVCEYLHFVARARGVTGARLKERMDAVLDQCGLRPVYRKLIRELSKGYRQRTGLAQALIHDPSIVILDEPTSGLDPHQIVEVRDLVRELARGKTVILSTHILQEVEATADRIVIINQGRIVGDGTAADLRSRAGGEERTRVTLAGKREEVKGALSGVANVEQVRFAGEDNGYVTFTVHAKPGAQAWRGVQQLARDRGWELRELADKPLTLEETFLALTRSTENRESVRGGAA